MKKEVLILDLDNTIYPVPSIGEELFKSLFQLIINNGEFDGSFENIKKEILRKPFQNVAIMFNFSDHLTYEGIEMLKELTYEKQMFPFEDYKELKKLTHKKFLVTTGFKNMQQSKVIQLGIDKDFEEIHIVDPTTSNQTKKDIFEGILKRFGYTTTEVIVIGDDLNSEIQAGIELGIDVILYDKMNFNPNITTIDRITNFNQIVEYI